MSSFRLLSVVMVVVAVAACGFRPLYGPASDSADDPVTDSLAAVQVGVIADRDGQMLRNHLHDLLNPGRVSVADAYRLDVTLDSEASDIARETSGFATRTAVRVRARFKLVDAASGQTLINDRTRVVTAFNIIDNKYSTVIADEGARERAVRQIAYDIRRRLAVYFATAAAPASVGLDAR